MIYSEHLAQGKLFWLVGVQWEEVRERSFDLLNILVKGALIYELIDFFLV